MCDMWVAGFLRRSPRRAQDILDPGLVSAAVEVFAGLPRSAGRQVLLCTDLHAGNVLAAEREPWLVIDPKPYVGDPLRRPPARPQLPRAPRRGSRSGSPARLAALADLDADRVRLWLFARCTIESLERPDLARAARTLAP